MDRSRKVPELLAPAGHEESLRAALAAGADAVYFGGSFFSNRMRAKNFSDNAIRDAVKLCHSVGAAAHITVNTRVFDREFDGVLSFAETVLGGRDDERADALIVADLGVARAIKTEYPDAVLHASTQTSMISPSDCKALRGLGFSRLVVPREMSVDEIRSLVSQSPIEIEMFVHGAHCVSCSGQCLMSFVMGGRSGNRGECAQPCRLPYKMVADGKTVGGEYPLSMADMCLGGHIPEIISSGVASLKIEGRLKNPQYVYGVTKIYRRLLDEVRRATPDEMHALEDLFTRGFTDGYFVSQYRKMSGSKSSERLGSPTAAAKEISAELSRLQSEHRAAKTAEKPFGKSVRAKFYLHGGERAVFELYSDGAVGHAEGQVPSVSTGNPITEESAAKNLTKLGESGFALDKKDIEFSLDDGLWMPLSALNELRRMALASLSVALGENDRTDETEEKPRGKKTFALPEKIGGKRECEKVAEIADLSLFTGGNMTGFEWFADNFARVYLPLSDCAACAGLRAETKAKLCAVMPVLSSVDGRNENDLRSLRDAGITRVMCHTVGQMRLVRSLGLTADISFRGSVTNSAAARVYAELGAASVVLSPEVAGSAARDIALSCTSPVGVIGYGRLPVMHLSRCIISGGACRKGNKGGRRTDGAKPHDCFGELCDRMGEKFPVLAQNDCTNVIYNSTPIWMGDRQNELLLGGYAGETVFMFTTENMAEAEEIISAYERGEKRNGRRIL